MPCFPCYRQAFKRCAANLWGKLGSHDDAGTGATDSSAALPWLANFIATVSKMEVTFAAVLAEVSVKSIPFLRAHRQIHAPPAIRQGASSQHRSPCRNLDEPWEGELPFSVLLPCLCCDFPLLCEV